MNHAGADRRGPLGLLAAALVRRARLVLVIGVLVAGGAGVASATLLPLMSSATGDVNAPSARANDRVAAITQTSPLRDDVVLVVDVADGWPSTSGSELVSRVVTRLGAVPDIVDVAAPAADGSTPALVSTDGRRVLVTAGIRSSAVSEDVAGLVETKMEVFGSRVAVGGSAAVSRELDERITNDLALAELVAFPLLFLLALVIFRGVVAAIIPLLVGGFSVVVSLALLRGIVELLPISQYVLDLVIGLGIGLAIDYSLFLISRYREEVLVDGYGAPAVIRTVKRAGGSVLFSALTVALALATLMLFPQSFLYSMGIGGVLVVASASIGAVVLVPAMLLLLGPRVNAASLARWNRAQLAESADATRSGWYRWSKGVMRHAGLVLPASLVIVGVLAAPALSTRFSDADETALPTSSPTRQVSDTIAADFPGGDGTSLFLVVTADRSSTAGVEDLARNAVSAAGSGALAAGPAEYLGESTWLIPLQLPGSPYSTASSDAVTAVRALSGPGPFLVGGPAAAFVDLESSIATHLPWALGIAALAILVVMFLVTGSVVLAVKTVVLNALNVAMTFGVLVWIFQFGNLEWLFGFESTGRIDLTQPILVAIIAFGLSTDYGVFVFSRIREAHDAGLADVEAVPVGLGRSGRIVSSAALLLVIAIGAFSSSTVLFIKELGVGAAVAVILDVTLVRALLVPSAMKLMGAVNWWAPPFLLRVHRRFGIGEDGGPASAAPARSGGPGAAESEHEYAAVGDG